MKSLSNILSMVAYLIGKQTLYKILKRPLVFMVQCKKQLTALNNNKKKDREKKGGGEKEGQSLL